jgi:2-dehydro-3-deoxyphosphogluconate aldolase/(4S)-4-hydroxy-2-oxoglutarate aldolase
VLIIASDDAMHDLRVERAERLSNPGLIAVVRSPSADAVPRLAQALLAGGVTAIEITTTTPNFDAAIAKTRQSLAGKGIVGAGTILTPEQAKLAIHAGAEFIVSPILADELIDAYAAAGVPILLGAFTPTECHQAQSVGADFVKLFPADTLGPGFIRSLLAPMPFLKLVPTGGVDVANIAAFFAAGCKAVGIGSSLVKNDWIRDERWADLTALARTFRDASGR